MTNQVRMYKKQGFNPTLDIHPQVRDKDFFFHLLMFFHRPATWSPWQVAAKLVFWAGCMFGLWWLAAPNLAPVVSLALLAFTLADWLLLTWLPKMGCSFGPVNPQLMIMLIPRLLVAISAAGLAALSQPAWGLIAFVSLELVGGIAYIWGLALEPQRLGMSELKVSSPYLAPDAKPIRMLHLSDFHVERLTRREEKVLQFIETAQPDLIVITGDYLNASTRRDPEAMGQVRRLLSRIKAPHGVYAVLGTPCIDTPIIATSYFKGTDIQLLRQDIIELDLGEDRKLALLGLDCTHDLIYDGHLFNHLVTASPTDTTRVFLYHSPELMPQTSQHDLNLYLCGHTHGGQVRLPGYGAFFTSCATGKRYEMGRYDENGTTLYISRGIGLEGFSMPRMRLFCPPEITLVTIEGEKTL